MNWSILTVIVVFVATNCKSEDPVLDTDFVCGVADPVNNLKWLNDQYRAFLGGPEINGIVLYDYNDRQVIEVQSGIFSSTNQHQYYCDGVKLDLDSAQALGDYYAKRTEVAVLYGTKMWR